MKTDESGRRLAEERLMGGVVVVGRYRLEGEFVVEEYDAEVRVYWPAAHAELPSRLAAVSVGDTADILAFAQSYGLLSRDGEPDRVSWVLQEAWNIRTCLELAARMTRGGSKREESLKSYFQSALGRLGFSDDGASGWSALLEGAVTYSSAHPRGRLSGSATSIAATIVENIINPNLQTVMRTLISSDGRFSSDFRFDGLIDVVYWHLADAITRGRLRRCKYCGSVFIARNPKRDRYCPRPPDEIGESRCALSARQKRHRRKPARK